MGKALPEGIDFRQKPTTEGSSQFIDVRGKKTRIRTWDPAENKWDYTSAGIKWSTHREIEVYVKFQQPLRDETHQLAKSGNESLGCLTS